MAVFSELDWGRFDVHAIVASEGLGVVDERHADACRSWLARHDYVVDEVDCTQGLAHVVIDLESRILRWVDQFGYEPNPERRSLDALADGFLFDAPGRAGRVLLLSRPDVPWQEDPAWMQGLFDIARTHSRQQLATGARFFCVLVLPEDSPLVGRVYASIHVPGAFRRATGGNPFET